jgi:hypothetical protein
MHDHDSKVTKEFVETLAEKGICTKRRLNDIYRR